jgi:hypothetical protein
MYSFNTCSFYIKDEEHLRFRYKNGVFYSEFIHADYETESIKAEAKKIFLSLRFSNIVNVRIRNPQGETKRFELRKKVIGGTRFLMIKGEKIPIIITRNKGTSQTVYYQKQKIGELSEQKTQLLKKARTCKIELSNSEFLIPVLAALGIIKLVMDTVPDPDEINLGYFGKIFKP